jgi:amino acid adenylation domain-containing protein
VRSLPDLVRNSADRWPEHPAIVMDGRVFSYAELESASNRIARTLIETGVKEGDRVMLWTPKSPESVAALYGIMKVGAAYVSVDPSAPAQRAGFIAKDCGAAAIITEPSRAAALDAEFRDAAPMQSVLYSACAGEAPPIAGVRSISWSEIESAAGAPVSVGINERNLAYILYTSGSTGQPKGVMISHAASLSFVEWAGDKFAIAHEDRLSNHAGFHFDLSTFDLYAGARAGATVFPVSSRVAPFPAALSKQWNQQQLTVCYATPSTFILLMSRGKLREIGLPSMRVVLFAGEVFATKHLRELMAIIPHARFANLYGPTETNVCTWYEVSSSPSDDRPIPIGRECENCQGFILDEQHRLVSDGEVGELWIGGGTLMEGYWGRADLTAQRLREIPNGNGRPSLAYNTGDLVRRESDGNLRYFGRRDHQVKTRGYRVELGEIEAVLSHHPGVDQAVIVAVPHDQFGNLLYGFVVAKSGRPPSEIELKAFLRQSLPQYMVPERIAFRVELPHTYSDKIDREALLREAIAQNSNHSGREG